jgi:ABC-2 type transport system permease protein
MPDWVQAFTLVNPLRWGVSTVHRIYLEGADFQQVLPLMTPLIIIAALSFAAAGWVFRHRLA